MKPKINRGILDSQKLSFKENAREWFDPTIRKKTAIGHIHLITQAINEIAQIIWESGFERARYQKLNGITTLLRV
jgi:phenylalanyl-tRNA synthetase alpha subunit